MRAPRFLPILALLGSMPSAWSAELPLDEDPGFIPYLAEPSRQAPAGFATANGDYLNGILCGSVALIPAKNSWGAPNGIEKAYHWQNGTWQEGAPWLPADRWPTSIRNGYLLYNYWDPEDSAYRVDVLASATGEQLWSIADLYLGSSDIGENTFVATDGRLSFAIYPREGESLSIPSRGYYVHKLMLDGGELLVLSADDLGDGQRWLERRSVATGAVLESWTLPARSEVFAFHHGKIIIGEMDAQRALRPMLIRSGSQDREPLDLPESAQPRSRVLLGPALDVNVNARTPTGMWFTLPGTSNDPSVILHCDLSGSDPVWTLGIDSSPISFNGYQVVTRKAWNQPLQIADATPGTAATAFLIPSRSPEISGVLPVKARLDRPSAATVRVRVASKNGGTATPGADYTVFDQWITFPPGAVEAEGSLVLKEDLTPEPHETLLLEITGIENANLPLKTDEVAVIEGSGVQRWISADPAPALPPPYDRLPLILTGGDGLLYQAIGRNQLQVSDPLTGTLLETVELSLDSQRIDTTSINGYYGPSGGMGLTATADGVTCRLGGGTTYGSNSVQWSLSGRRTLPGWHLRIANAVEGGAPGLIEATAAERTTAAIPARLVVSSARMEHGTEGLHAEYCPLSPADLAIPADGTTLRFDLPINSEMVTHRERAPIRLQFYDSAGFIAEQYLLEPSPSDYEAQYTQIPLDPALAKDGIGGFMRRGDSLWVGFPEARQPASKKSSGCIQELDAATYEVRRTIWAPAKLKHRGFGERIIDMGKDIFVEAIQYVDSPNSSTKTTRTICILDAATGNDRAVIPWKYYDDPTVAFDDKYVAIASASDQHGKRKTPGGLHLYSRATFKQVASVKLAGESGGSSMTFAGGALWLGVPNAEWRPPGLPKKEHGALFAGAVIRFGSLPSLKTGQVFHSPAATWAPSQFGINVDLADDGSVIARAFNGVFRFDPVTLEITPSPSSARLLPLRNFSRGEGLRADDYYHAIYDEETGLRLTDLSSFGKSVISKDSFLYSVWEGILSVPFDRAGSFALWQRYAPELPGDTRPDLQRYVEEQVGSLPVVTLTHDDTYYRGYPTVSISAPMPPDMTMLVETSVAGGPWEVVALRNGAGPVRNRFGVSNKTAPNEISTPYSIPLRGARFRARYDLTTNLPLSLSDYRFFYVKP
ncbi:hypothetical protein OKA05_23650 [Luteolibacter arcticus]|uniref:Calx-beta domain-containing protein n=1 Tax=Luteolibacter arcticus TaxID=1581411 RepID=A0ABT3GPY9_9BACT|nr:hypothetical protein [Luteolibacter arcticus]MCW1925574.1 hypothetical protein [Luteolibacter arcticus]